MRLRVTTVSLLSLALAGCHNSSTGSSPTPIVPTALRVEGSQTRGGEGDALAAALLLSTKFPLARPGRAQIAMGDAAFANRLVAMSSSHLFANGITAAAGAGQAGSDHIRRLAAASNAPKDLNGDGSNLDETLATYYRDLAARAGGLGLTVQRPTLFPWQDGSADFANAIDPTEPSAATAGGQTGLVDTAQVGQAMLARVLLASGLLQSRRGNLVGETANRGTFGLIMLQQAIAIEETVFGRLFVDKGVLGGMRFPQDYQPKNGVRYVPRSVRVGMDAAGHPSSYSLRDRSSDLAGLAALLRAGGELAFLASGRNPNETLRASFQGFELGRLPDPEDQQTGGGIVTWESGVDRIMSKYCVSCHDANFPPAPGGFAVNSYDHVHAGGGKSRPGSKTPIITRGDPNNSVLYYILLDNPPNNFDSMPLRNPNEPGIPAADKALIKKWIEDGARSAPPRPPRIGVDLAVTMYKNLIALHVGSKGELFEAHDGDAPVPFTNPGATGAALQALAAVAQLENDLTDWRKNTQAVADWAAQNLVAANGDVVRSFDLTAGKADGVADLQGHAQLTAGLFAAARVLGSSALLARAELAAKRLVAAFFDDGKSLFRSAVGVDGADYSPAALAAVVDALREMAAANVKDAVLVHERFLKRLLPVLAFAEMGTHGEILGDGDPDTDGNGLREPALAGGEFGRAPLFAGRIKEGAAVTPPNLGITWSTHIQPLFRNTCGACHMDGSTRGGGYLLDTPALLRKTINPTNPMPLVVPGDPEGSFLYRKLVDGSPTFGERMPLATPALSARGIELVRQWILQGANSR